MQNNIHFVICIFFILIISCKSVKHAPRFFTVTNHGKELNINYGPFINLNKTDSLQLEKINNTPNPYSPIPWYSFSISQSDSAEINLYSQEKLIAILFQDYLEIGEYYLNFKKIKIPASIYYLQFITSQDTIVETILLGRENLNYFY